MDIESKYHIKLYVTTLSSFIINHEFFIPYRFYKFHDKIINYL